MRWSPWNTIVIIAMSNNSALSGIMPCKWIECRFAFEERIHSDVYFPFSSPYCVIKAMQLSTMMGMSFLLSCWSFSVLALPPAAFWMSVYHREKSVRPMPCRCRVLNAQTHIQFHRHFCGSICLPRFENRHKFRKSPKDKAHLPFSTRTKMSFFSWLSVSDAIPLTFETEREKKSTN